MSDGPHGFTVYGTTPVYAGMGYKCFRMASQIHWDLSIKI
jgi:hypothetical protein